MHSTFEILRRAERVELRSADIYGALAERFAGAPAVHLLFVALHDEEVQHAARIRLLAARYSHDKRLLDGLVVAVGDVERLEALGDDVLASIERGDFDEDLPDLRRRLAMLEENYVRVHAQFVATGVHPELRSFFEVLAAQDEQHARLLSDLPV